VHVVAAYLSQSAALHRSAPCAHACAERRHTKEIGALLASDGLPDSQRARTSAQAG
jgi:hypothetical protein